MRVRRLVTPCVEANEAANEGERRGCAVGECGERFVMSLTVPKALWWPFTTSWMNKAAGCCSTAHTHTTVD